MAVRSEALRAYLKPVVEGLLVLVVGLVPWMLLARLNRTVAPEVPWAALATAIYMTLLLAWLHGRGWPRRTADERRRRLRGWPPIAGPGKRDGGPGAGAIVLLLAGLYALWIATGRLSSIPDLAAFPTTAYRWSMFLTGGIMSGVVEEAAYRGYMQTGLERHDPRNAVLITSLVFAGSHVTQGVGALLILGPGLFAASVLYGLLAQRTGTILPGVAIHVAGDLAYVFFGVLGGDASLLFVA